MGYLVEENEGGKNKNEENTSFFLLNKN